MAEAAEKSVAPSVLDVWDAAVALYGSNAERPLQIVLGNAGPDGPPYFLIGILPGHNRPVLVPLESRLPFVVHQADPPLTLAGTREHLGRVSVIRGDIQEDEFADIGEFLAALGKKMPDR